MIKIAIEMFFKICNFKLTIAALIDGFKENQEINNLLIMVELSLINCMIISYDDGVQ